MKPAQAFGVGRKGRADSFAVLGIGVALGLAGCAGQSGTSPSTGGATGQESGGGGTGGAGTAGGGAPSNAGADSNSNSSGASSVAGASGAGASGAGASGSDGTAGSDTALHGGAGGIPDTSMAGAGSPPGTGCTGLLFCDDFESYTNGAAPNGKWKTQVRGSAQAVVDTTMAYSGKQSVHFTGTVNQSSANIIAQSAPVFPIQGNTLFVRMMMYIKSYPATSGTHSRFMRVGTNTNGLDGTSYALDTYNGTGIEHVNSGMFRNTSLHLGDATVKLKWVCWEWELDNTAGPPSGDTGTVMAYLWHDSIAVPLTVTHDSLPWNPIPWQLLEVGLEAYQSDAQPGDFWVDDVALSNSKIGCPAAP